MTTGSTIEVTLNPKRLSSDERARVLQNLGFGRVFTEHMVSIRYTAETGWAPGRLVPYAPLSLDPAASVLHYG